LEAKEVDMSTTPREPAAPPDRNARREDRKSDEGPAVAPIEPDPAEGSNDTPPPNPGSPAG
jgi:hypothetical protein